MYDIRFHVDIHGNRMHVTARLNNTMDGGYKSQTKYGNYLYYMLQGTIKKTPRISRTVYCHV